MPGSISDLGRLSLRLRKCSEYGFGVYDRGELENSIELRADVSQLKA
jgi:hypothetical protein